jgi:hypothetical protein
MSVTSLAGIGEGVEPARKINYTKFCRVGEMWSLEGGK